MNEDKYPDDDTITISSKSLIADILAIASIIMLASGIISLFGILIFMMFK